MKFALVWGAGCGVWGVWVRRVAAGGMGVECACDERDAMAAACSYCWARQCARHAAVLALMASGAVLASRMQRVRQSVRMVVRRMAIAQAAGKCVCYTGVARVMAWQSEIVGLDQPLWASWADYQFCCATNTTCASTRDMQLAWYTTSARMAYNTIKCILQLVPRDVGHVDVLLRTTQLAG